MLLQSFHKLRFVAFSLVACMMLVTTSYAQEGLSGGSRSVGDGSSAQQRVGSVFRDANGVLQVVIPLEVLLKANNGLLQGSARHHAYDGGSDPDPPIDEPTEIAGSWRTANGLDANARGVGYEDPEEGSPLNSAVLDTLSDESRAFMTCPKCSGLGRYLRGFQHVRCDRCNGDGRVKDEHPLGVGHSGKKSSNTYIIKLSNGYSEYKSYSIDGNDFRVNRGRYRTHTRTSRSVQVRYDQILGSGRRYTTTTISPGTYEFRRSGNTAYLVKIK